MTTAAVRVARPERRRELDEVVLDPATETVIALMASALIAVVRGAEPTTETADER